MANNAGSHNRRQPAPELEWSKYVLLLSIRDENERSRLEKIALEENLTKYQLKKFIENFRLRNSKEKEKEKSENLKLQRGSLYRYSLVEREKVPIDRGDVLIDCGFNTWRRVNIENLENNDEHKIFKLRKENDRFFITEKYKNKKDELLYTYKGYVEKVIDGDTLWVDIDCGFNIISRQKVRLNGIDASELIFDEGKKAADVLERVLKME